MRISRWFEWWRDNEFYFWHVELGVCSKSTYEPSIVNSQRCERVLLRPFALVHTSGLHGRSHAASTSGRACVCCAVHTCVVLLACAVPSTRVWSCLCVLCRPHVCAPACVCCAVHTCAPSAQRPLVQCLYFRPRVSRSKCKTGDVVGTTALFKVLYYKMKGVFFIFIVCFYVLFVWKVF